MADGRKAEQAGDARGATLAFARAVELRPQSAQALTELGWAAFLSGDLPRAEQASREAAKIPSINEKQRGAALYNLGRVLEARGDRSGAIKAYSDSIADRSSGVVLTRLAQLDPQAAAAADPLRPKPMEGPFPSLAAYCKTQENNGVRGCVYKVSWGKTPGLSAKLPAPYRQVRLFRQEDDCQIAVQTERGVFVHGFYCAWHEWKAKSADFEVTDLIPGGQQELVLRVFNHTGHKIDVEIEDDDGKSSTIHPEVGLCERTWIVCGIGDSKVPSCTDILLAEKDDCDDANDKVNWSWQLTPTFGPEGKLELTPQSKLPPNSDTALSGLHILRFP